MLRSVIVACGLGFTLAGCTNSSIRSEESHACSINQSDDPLLVCSPASDLVCISTYTVPVTNVKEAPKYDGGLRSVYVCRLACSADSDCARQEGDVCCPGSIYGKTYGKTAGCVPASLCNARPDEDGGTDDALPPVDVAKLDARSADRAMDVTLDDAARADADKGDVADAAATGADGSGSEGDAPTDAAVPSPDASTTD